LYPPGTPSRVLIVKRDKIGDLLLTTSLLSHIRAVAPHLELHLLANDYNAWVAKNHPAVHRLWVYPRVRHGGRMRIFAALAHLPLMQSLRHQRFDVAIAMNGEPSPRATSRALAVRARRTIAFVAPQPTPPRRLADALPPPAGWHELDRMALLLRPLSIMPPSRWPEARFCVDDDARARVRHWLASQRVAPRQYAVIGVGARWREKQPSAEQVVRWSHLLHAELGLDTVFVWTPGKRDDPLYPGDDEIAQAVLARAAAHVHPFRGSIQDVAALVHDARTTLVPDSGVMHLAAATPGGVVGLFAKAGGHDDVERWHPIGARARWIFAPTTVAALPDDIVWREVAMLAGAPAAHHA